MDIVERLRDPSDCSLDGTALKRMYAAADKIEQLREALGYYADFESNTDGDGAYGKRVHAVIWEHDEGRTAKEALTKANPK